MAAGVPGLHFIDLNDASNATPYLNPEQGPGLHILHLAKGRSWTFTVTGDTVSLL